MSKIVNDIEEVAQLGLCHGCGTCVGICPRDALHLVESDEGTYIPSKMESLCNDCGLCIGSCPGLAVDFVSFSEELFGAQPDDLWLGYVRGCYVGGAADEDIRHQGASGGAVSTILLYAMEEGLIDGAIVTTMDPENPLRPRVALARNPEEILGAARSKYCPVPVGLGIKYVMEQEGRYAVVGLPCHIHGWRMAAHLSPKIKKRVVLHLGLFCSHTVTFAGTQFLLRRLHISDDEVVSLAYRAGAWPGGLLVRLKDGTARYEPHRKYWVPFFGRFFFMPNRCALCCDGVAELADISFGDAWLEQFSGSPKGMSVLITRSSMGDQFVSEAISAGVLQAEPLDQLSVVRSQQDQLYFKKKGLVARLHLRTTLGKRGPAYQALLKKPTFWDWIVAPIPFVHMTISNWSPARLAMRYIPTGAMAMYGNLVVQKLLNRTYVSSPTVSILSDAPKILIINSYSPNVGDLSIITSMIRTLHKAISTEEMAVLANVPQLTSTVVDVPVFKWLSRISGTTIRSQVVNLLMFARSVTWACFHRMGLDLNFMLGRSSRAALKAFAEADIVLSCGGGYLHDNHGSAFLGHLYDIYIGILLGKPVVLYAQSIGPFKNRFLRIIAKFVLDRVALITLREEISLHFLRKMDIRGPRVIVTADAALTLPQTPVSAISDLLRKAGLIEQDTQSLFCITVTPNLRPREPNYPERLARYQDTLTRLAEHILSTVPTARILFVPMDVNVNNGGDVCDGRGGHTHRMKNLVATLLSDKDFLATEAKVLDGILGRIETRDRVSILKDVYSPSDVKAILAKSQILIATRMHSLIFAATSGVPLIAIAYEPKMLSFMAMLRQEDYAVDISDLSKVDLIEMFDRLWQNREAASAQIKSRVRELIKASLKNAELVEEMVRRMNWNKAEDVKRTE